MKIARSRDNTLEIEVTTADLKDLDRGITAPIVDTLGRHLGLKMSVVHARNVRYPGMSQLFSSGSFGTLPLRTLAIDDVGYARLRGVSEHRHFCTHSGGIEINVYHESVRPSRVELGGLHTADDRS